MLFDKFKRVDIVNMYDRNRNYHKGYNVSTKENDIYYSSVALSAE